MEQKLAYVSVAVLACLVIAYLGATGELRRSPCPSEAASYSWDPYDGAESAVAALVEAGRSGDSAVLAVFPAGEVRAARLEELIATDSPTRIDPPPAADGEYAVYRNGDLAGLVTVDEQPDGFVVSESRLCS